MSFRLKKVESLLQKELGTLFQKHYQQHGMITVSDVKITADLSIAKVYLSLLTPGVDNKTAFNQLKVHESDVRFRLSKLIRHQLRKMPELHFYYDDRTEHSAHMESLFNRIEKERPSDLSDDHQNEQDESRES